MSIATPPVWTLLPGAYAVPSPAVEPAIHVSLPARVPGRAAKWRSCKGSCNLPPTGCWPRRSSSSSSSSRRVRRHRRRLCSSPPLRSRRRHRGQQRLHLRRKQCLTWEMTMICSAASPWLHPLSRLHPPQQTAAQQCPPVHLQSHLDPGCRCSTLRRHRLQLIRSVRDAAQAPQATPRRRGLLSLAQAACKAWVGQRCACLLSARDLCLLSCSLLDRPLTPSSLTLPCRGPLDEDLFTSLSADAEGAVLVEPAAAASPAEEPEAAAPTPTAVAAGRPSSSAGVAAFADASLAAAAPEQPAAPAPAVETQLPLGAPLAVQPAAAEPAPAGAGAVAGRRKKVIRSRIGYARGPAAATDAASLAAALAGGGVAPAAPASAPAAAAPVPLSPMRPPSAADSMQSEGGGSYSPVGSAAAATSRPASQAASHASHGFESGPPHSASRQSSPGPEGGAERAGRQAAGGDAQHLTALQQHVAQLDIRLELPSRRSSELSGGAAAAALAQYGSGNYSGRAGSTGAGWRAIAAECVWGVARVCGVHAFPHPQ